MTLYFIKVLLDRSSFVSKKIKKEKTNLQKKKVFFIG